jgi:hypothetical protein
MNPSTPEAARRRRNVILTLVGLAILFVLVVLLGAAAAGNFSGFESMTPSPESLAPRPMALLNLIELPLA